MTITGPNLMIHPSANLSLLANMPAASQAAIPPA